MYDDCSQRLRESDLDIDMSTRSRILPKYRVIWVTFYFFKIQFDIIQPLADTERDESTDRYGVQSHLGEVRSRLKISRPVTNNIR